jgi:hypothetical protein
VQMLRYGTYFLCVAMSFSVRRISKLMSRTASMVYVIRARSPRALQRWQGNMCKVMGNKKRSRELNR